jgi:purine-nucleoside/S-methyl-5'-thioadenosine phosphorylase / adenosine deaminase
MRPSSRPRSSALSGPAPQEIESVDALFQQAGLVRSARRPQPRRPRPSRLDRVAPEELAPPLPVPRRAPNGVEWLPVPGWDLPWLWGGFSTRKGGLSRAYCADDAPGELNLGFTAADDRETVLANRRLLAEAVTGDAQTPLLALKQFHSNLVVTANAADAARSTSADPGRQGPRRADGQITDVPGLLLAVQTADCIPVLVADRRQRVVAAFHAGWRGTAKRIVETGVGRMRLAYGSRPADLIAAIGPGASACCYSVGEEVLSEFDSQFSYAREVFHEVFSSDPVKTKYPMLFLTQRAPGHSSIGPSLHVDLIEANRRQLLACGLSPRSIQVVGGCTQCQGELFFSHRASHGHTGRMMAVIGIREAAKRKVRSRSIG